MPEPRGEYRHVGRFAPYGFDGCGWLGGVEAYVKAEDYDRGTNYQADDHRLWAENARLRTALAHIAERHVEAISDPGWCNACTASYPCHDGATARAALTGSSTQEAPHADV